MIHGAARRGCGATITRDVENWAQPYNGAIAATRFGGPLLATATQESAHRYREADYTDFEHTGPGTLARGAQVLRFKVPVDDEHLVSIEVEHLGRSDAYVVLLESIWQRELRELAEGRPLKQWQLTPDLVNTERPWTTAEQ